MNTHRNKRDEIASRVDAIVDTKIQETLLHLRNDLNPNEHVEPRSLHCSEDNEFDQAIKTIKDQMTKAFYRSESFKTRILDILHKLNEADVTINELSYLIAPDTLEVATQCDSIEDMIYHTERFLSDKNLSFEDGPVDLVSILADHKRA